MKTDQHYLLWTAPKRNCTHAHEQGAVGIVVRERAFVQGAFQGGFTLSSIHYQKTTNPIEGLQL